jgi:hypothetical protein
MARRTETRVMMMTIGKAFVGTRPAASLHRTSVIEEATETTVTYVMSSAIVMHASELKADIKIGSKKSKNNTMKGTMITMILTMTNLTGSGHQKRDTSQEVSRYIPKT